jgi:hypothetical protein
VVTNRPPSEGIKDYDLFYFDDSDLSWEAENEVIRAGEAAFRDLPVAVEIRNEARVHLWYEGRFGVPCAPKITTALLWQEVLYGEWVTVERIGGTGTEL